MEQTGKAMIGGQASATERGFPSKWDYWGGAPLLGL